MGVDNMARVRITIEANGSEVTVENYVGSSSTTGDDGTYNTLASVIQRAVAALAGPDRYGDTMATVCGLLVRNADAPRPSPLLDAAAKMREELKPGR